MIHSRVDDVHGRRVGKVAGIEGDWLLVRLGHFEDEVVRVPLTGSSAAAGHVYVPFERDVIRSAPRIGLENGGPTALLDHYRLDGVADAPPELALLSA